MSGAHPDRAVENTEPRAIRVLILDRSSRGFDAKREHLRSAGLPVQVTHARDEDDLTFAMRSSWDVVVTDDGLADLDRAAAFGVARSMGAPLVVVSDRFTTAEDELPQIPADDLSGFAEAVRHAYESARIDVGVLDWDASARAISAPLANISRTGEVLSSNPAFQELCQATTLAAMVEEVDTAAALAALDAVVQDGQQRRLDVQLKDPGRLFTLVLDATGEGDFRCAVATLVDLEDERADQAERLAFQRALELSAVEQERRFLVQFLGAAAHEIGNVLTPIALQLRIMQASSLEGRPAKAVDRMNASLARGRTLLRDLLDAARLRTGPLTLDPTETDLARLAQDCAADHEEAARGKGISLVVDVRACPVMADPTRIAQVLDNLVSNAIKFTEEGNVTVRVRQVTGGGCIEVQDTGPGLDADQARALFQPFTRVHTELHVPGTGLGLHVSKGIVEAHGGTIKASSGGPGKGATFTVDLPAVAEQPAADEL